MALGQRKIAEGAFKHRREHFANLIGLHPRTKGHKLADVPTVTLKKLAKIYPPSGYDIYESAKAREIWASHRATTPFPDPRGGRTWKPFHRLDPQWLQYIVDQDSSAIIRDYKTNSIVGAVIRNFSNDNHEILNWLNGIITENTGLRRNIRVSTVP
jgi:hypothetical protein